uniref:Protein yippee-like n=1 Tax=Syphacia muris TaxID=451379 RepID=A0A0N5AYP8_9BILA
MGRIFLEHLGGNMIFSCGKCKAYLTNEDELISKHFTGSTGPAFLFNQVVNIEYSETQMRTMITGRHIVRDVSCKRCKAKLGWMYEYALNDPQRYKEAKVILERALIDVNEGIEQGLWLSIDPALRMGRFFYEHLGGKNIFSCGKCEVYLSNRSEVIATNFRGNTGRAFLFRRVVNILEAEKESREMLSGTHLIRDVFCKRCGLKLGWMYEYTAEDSQRYKEGRIILERKLVREVEEVDEKLIGHQEEDDSISGYSSDNSNGYM